MLGLDAQVWFLNSGNQIGFIARLGWLIGLSASTGYVGFCFFLMFSFIATMVLFHSTACSVFHLFLDVMRNMIRPSLITDNIWAIFFIWFSFVVFPIRLSVSDTIMPKRNQKSNFQQ